MNESLQRVRFSIGAKLILIISIIVLISLGSITALVSWLVRADLQIAAEEKNFEANRRSAMEAESTFRNIRAHSEALIRIITFSGKESALARESAEFFFAQNPQVAAVFFSAGQTEELLTNRRFFESQGIDISLAQVYRDNERTVLRRAAAGETVLLNAAPHFTVSMLAVFFPAQIGGITAGGVATSGVAVLFSPNDLNDTFGFGTNQSWLLNDAGDVLVHADSELVLAGVNMEERSFTRYVRNSPARNAQSMYTDEAGTRYFGAFTKLNTGGATVITGIEYDKVFEGLAATTRRNIYLTVVVLAVSVLLIWFYAKTISVPLKGLAAAARTIEGGSFDLELKPKGSDEIGILTASFKHMCTALGIFGKFTNRDIAVRAMRGEIKPGGLPKHATVFFSDIRSFTELSETFTKTFGDDASDRIVHWLNEYFTCMVECVEKTNGVVDKFIGDAVMAHWGTAYTAGSPQKDAYNCIASALMMRKALHELNKKRKPNDPGSPPIRIGCGINTGVVTAGQIGSDLRMEYTAIGDPVNLASRIEALNKPLGTDILISEDTWNMVKDHFITEEMPSVSVKGKEKPVRIFAVVAAKGAEKGPQTIAEVRTLLGINAPDISGVDLNSDEVKYKIGGKE
ncbi:MAG: adenylate/guanylate cyclase domain-containing protein [Treponema sp.]|jgi:adenylate cyclase|nr:adenylate/guanylate cyclase domain-containing protein [Treponema sp.]